jgi:hypothetical protein
MKTDTALRGEVLDELEWEPGINATGRLLPRVASAREMGSRVVF